MSDSNLLDEVFALAIQLSPGDRLKLVERVVSSVEREIAEEQPVRIGHWGKHLLETLDTLDFTDWTNIQTDDPVDWVNQVRRENEKNRGLDWELDE